MATVEIQLGGRRGGVALIDEEDLELVKGYTWYQESTGYARSSTRKRLHRVIMGNPANLEIDHINGNKLDCRKQNLRIATHKQNTRNVAMHSDNMSGYKGVCRIRPGKYKAQINSTYIGCFETPEEAAIAYNKKAVELYGEFARLNKVGWEYVFGMV